MTIVEAYEVLRSVKDPEIPTVSITDLGILADLRVRGNSVEVDLMPTFSGCPALELIKQSVESALLSSGATKIKVSFVNSPAWTTDVISQRGRDDMRSFGIAPPTLQTVPCPYCGSHRTRMESDFGPTPCRSVYYCDSCHNPFETMKPML